MSIIDEIRSLSGPDEDLVGDIIDTWEGDAPNRLNDLKQAVAAGDADGAHRAVHTLKGSSANLGLNGLVAACATMDSKVREGNLADAATDLATIEQAFARARELLNSLRA